MLDDNCPPLEYADENGEENFSRDDSNLDRGSREDTMDMVESICKSGAQDWVSGVPVIRQHESKPKKYYLITWGHRVAAIYHARKHHWRNPNVRVTWTRGLRRAIKIRPNTPLDVRKWLKKYANQFGGGYTLVEHLNDILEADASCIRNMNKLRSNMEAEKETKTKRKTNAATQTFNYDHVQKYKRDDKCIFVSKNHWEDARAACNKLEQSGLMDTFIERLQNEAKFSDHRTSHDVQMNNILKILNVCGKSKKHCTQTEWKNSTIELLMYTMPRSMELYTKYTNRINFHAGRKIPQYAQRWVSSRLCL